MAVGWLATLITTSAKWHTIDGPLHVNAPRSRYGDFPPEATPRAAAGDLFTDMVQRPAASVSAAAATQWRVWETLALFGLVNGLRFWVSMSLR